jgi:hypothetical protein
MQHLQVFSSSRRAPPYPPRRAAALPLSISTRERARRAAKAARRLELRAVHQGVGAGVSPAGARAPPAPSLGTLGAAGVLRARG